jgi:hypothetical protein
MRKTLVLPPITEPLDSDLMKQVEYDMDEQGADYLILYDHSNGISQTLTGYKNSMPNVPKITWNHSQQRFLKL